MFAFELKPCPFCGQPPVVETGNNYTRVKCNNFECWILPKTDIYTDAETAYEAWNCRAED